MNATTQWIMKGYMIEFPIQQTQNICITFIQRRPNVFDVGPTLYKRYTDVFVLAGYHFINQYWVGLQYQSYTDPIKHKHMFGHEDC